MKEDVEKAHKVERKRPPNLILQQELQEDR